MHEAARPSSIPRPNRVCRPRVGPPRVILPSMRLFPLLLCLSLSAVAQDEPPAAGGGRGGPGSTQPINETPFSSLRARQIGPAFVSGRVSQIAVFPDDSNHYLIALASGNI